LLQLQKYLKNTLIKAKLLSITMNELTNNTQTIWRTFEYKESKEPLQKPGIRSQDTSNNRTTGDRSRPPARPIVPDTPENIIRNRNRLSIEEKKKRKKTDVCFNCRLMNHISQDYRYDFYPYIPQFDNYNRQNNKRPTSDAELEDQLLY